MQQDCTEASLHRSQRNNCCLLSRMAPPPPVQPENLAGKNKEDWKTFVPGAPPPPTSPISAALNAPLESGALPDGIMEWVQASVDELTSARNTLKAKTANHAFFLLLR